MRRLVAIGLIWFGCALAWMILGSSVVVRSGEASSSLGREVSALWGSPVDQRPPSAFFTDAKGARHDVGLDASDIAVKLDLEQRKKGLEWFPTYAADFRARYTLTNPDDGEQRLVLEFPLRGDGAIYDGFDVTSGGKSVGAEVTSGAARWTMTLPPHTTRQFSVVYRTRGTASFRYEPTSQTGQVRDFHLVADGNFKGVDFPAGSISPTLHRAAGGRWHGEWRFKTLVASAPIGIDLPKRLDPGPLAARITFFAPVGLLFFFFVVAILGTARERAIHPLNFFFLGCSFFAFHLLFAYLVDHVAIAPSFVVASLVSVGLSVSYARLFTGWRFALGEIGLSQLVYLVLFSFSFFWTGFTGLAITVGAIVTLFVMMQMTGRTPFDSVEARGGPYRSPAAPPA